jgi:hypothetical protein
MPQQESAARLGHGDPAGLSIAKSEEAANGRATQQRPKQFVQSASRSRRPGGTWVLRSAGWPPATDVVVMPEC